jgi:sulfur-oxidizing protein SoxZ
MKINGSGDLSITFTDTTGEVNEKSIKIQPKG